MKKELSKRYEPNQVEEKIYSFWEKDGYFKPKIEASKKSFTIVIPPPNITGSLHMGHALNNTIIDILIRWQRMKGKVALYQPGTDHAGIATQNVVEKELIKEGKTRYDLGREKFVERAWQWKEKYGNQITEQLKKLGCSCDWSRNRFTLDEDYSKAVETAFKHYYDKGWIYQGTRVVNWCPRCQTSISDLEVKYVEQEAKLYYFKYDKNFPITIATTRPETKLGDTAVAVNLKDSRYKKYIGKVYDIDFAGIKRKIKIVASNEVDPKFGTGAVGLTPAHSLVDEKIANENNLEKIKIISENGKMTEKAGKDYQGLNVKEAREKVINWLKKNSLLEKEEDIINNLATCDRCGTVIEPLPSKQWFLKMSELAKPAIEVVKKGKIKFHPPRWKKVYLDWLENIQDWCISRQLWWGHRLPVWYCQNCIETATIDSSSDIEGTLPGSIRHISSKEFIVSIKKPKEKCKKCNNKVWVQDPDVLDTWFSSALWPFAVFDKPSDLEYFYPTDILSTARDIIFLWVARMVFSALEFTDKIPFSEVYIHPTVLTSKGKRMSKSLGTGVDPLELIKEYGADAVRFGIAWHLTGLQDLRFKEDTIVASRNFCNKIWNSARFILINIENSKQLTSNNKQPKPETKADKKILNQLNQLIDSVNSNIEQYNFGHAAQDLYHFFWHEFCDIYLEESKKQLRDNKLKENTQQVLFYTLSLSLRLLHPFMPFVTEEIWQTLGFEKPLIISDWPKQQLTINNKIKK